MPASATACSFLDEGAREIPLANVAEVRVRDGNHLVAGLLVGGAVDLAVLTVVVVAAATAPNEMSFSIGSFR